MNDVASKRKIMHFCRDERTGTHQSQVEEPIARRSKLARIIIEMISVGFEDIVMIYGVAQLAGKTEESGRGGHSCGEYKAALRDVKRKGSSQ